MITNINMAKTLTEYNSWTNKLIYEAVAKLPPEKAAHEHTNLFGTIIRALNHNYIVGLIWQAHLEGREHGFTEVNPKDCPQLAELWSLQQLLDRWYINYSDKLSTEVINEPINFKLIGGKTGTMTRGEILLHIINHTTYHRGFIADMFYKISEKPPTTDLPVFLSRQL